MASAAVLTSAMLSASVPSFAADSEGYDVYQVSTSNDGGQPVLTAFNPGMKFIRITGSSSTSGLTYGLTADGKVWTNSRQQNTNIPDGVKIIDIDLDYALASDGTVYFLNQSDWIIGTMPAGTTKIVAYTGATAGITKDGDAYSFMNDGDTTVTKIYDHTTNGPATDIAEDHGAFYIAAGGKIYLAANSSTIKPAAPITTPSGVIFGPLFSGKNNRATQSIPDTVGRIWNISSGNISITNGDSGYADPTKQSTAPNYYLDADGFIRTRANNRKVIGRTFIGLETTESGTFVYEDSTYNHHDSATTVGQNPQSGDPAASILQRATLLIGMAALGAAICVMLRAKRLSIH